MGIHPRVSSLLTISFSDSPQVDVLQTVATADPQIDDSVGDLSEGDLPEVSRIDGSVGGPGDVDVQVSVGESFFLCV